MTGSVLAALQAVGQDAVLLGESGSSPVFAASIQPRMGLAAEDSGPLGAGRERRFNLFAPPGLGIRAGMRLQSGGRIYLVLAAEEHLLAGDPCYTQGVLALEEEVAS